MVFFLFGLVLCFCWSNCPDRAPLVRISCNGRCRCPQSPYCNCAGTSGRCNQSCCAKCRDGQSRSQAIGVILHPRKLPLPRDSALHFHEQAMNARGNDRLAQLVSRHPFNLRRPVGCARVADFNFDQGHKIRLFGLLKRFRFDPHTCPAPSRRTSAPLSGPVPHPWQ